MSGMIKNPILPGFNPDPSIIRVGDDYYIATSTFEWFPGVQIHHSRDLMHWKLAARPLNRVSQLDMKGNPDSCGIWAPCLSYDNGTFYLIYTDVKNVKAGFMDAHNYLVTTNDICGDWSEPIYLNSSGFDPSLFHDEDGRKWLVNMTCDKAPGKEWFGGIILQEYDPQQKKLVGPIRNIFAGTELGCTEGPHLYRKHGYYYLLVAEGGTGTNHAVTIARSQAIAGPYELDPRYPMLTAKDDPQNPIQKAGHADFVETRDGQLYMVHLCGRPIPEKAVCTLGRETCIQKVVWTEDFWLRLENGDCHPSAEVQAPGLPEQKWASEPARDDFDTERLNIHFQTLRVPLGEDTVSLKERTGYLRLKGRESLNSLFHQCLVARRQQAFRYTASTCVEFQPESFKQMAGLVCYYNTENYHYLTVTHNETLGKCITIVSCNNYKVSYPIESGISADGWSQCYLQANVDYDKLQFRYSSDGETWKDIGPVLDASILSDEACKVWWGFTGAFVGLCCQDLSGQRKHADFDFFEYHER